MRPPARLLVLLACLFALVGFAGCGSDESAGPLDSSLGYLPADAPFAVAIDTDVDGEQIQALNTLIKKFPFGEAIRDAFLKNLAKEATGVDLEKDVVPLLGNPFVVGAADSSSFLDGSDENGFVAAIEVSDEDKLNDLLEKTGATEEGEQSGATIYDADGTEFAVDGSTVVFAGSRELLNAALERHGGEDALDEDTFNESLEGVGDDGLVQAHVNLQSLLEGSDGARDARKVKWVGAVESIGLNGSVRNDGIDIDFAIRTNPDGLTEEDLPIGAGPEAPAIIERPGEIGIGVRDIGQIVGFVEDVAQAVDPSGYGDYAAAKSQLEKRLGVDVEKDLLDQLSGDISASIALSGDFGVRVEPKDPAAFERTLSKIADALPSLAEGLGLDGVALEKPSGGEDLYALAQPNGNSIVFGVKDGVFVITNDPARADSLALDDPVTASGAEGAVVVQADAEELANVFLAQLGDDLPIPEQLRPALTRPLGELSGSLKADTSGITGRLSLEIE
ncbi:MAG TPA: DUF3352 domain-containing protein [Thermoleophilaceae bacterium]|nr:DUF3352 domain-containing protein [Thermoleophilaceae bacterium]